MDAPKRKKVTSGFLFEQHQLHISESGKIDFDQVLKDELYEKEEHLRAKIILDINEFAGDDWQVNFTPDPQQQPTFWVDIEVKDRNNLRRIKAVIDNALPEYDLYYMEKGTHTPFAKTIRVRT